MATKVIDVSVPPEFDTLYCPVCGQQIIGPVRCGDGIKNDIDIENVSWADDDAQPKCKHLLFLYLDSAGGFIYTSPACRKAVAKAEKAVYRDVDPIKYALKHIDSSKQSNILCFSTTASGFGCGPWSVTLCVAIDFGPSEGEEDSGTGGQEHPEADETNEEPVA